MTPHRNHFFFYVTGDTKKIKKLEAKVEDKKFDLHVDCTDLDIFENTATVEFITHRKDARKFGYFLKENINAKQRILHILSDEDNIITDASFDHEEINSLPDEDEGTEWHSILIDSDDDPESYLNANIGEFEAVAFEC